MSKRMWIEREALEPGDMLMSWRAVLVEQLADSIAGNPVWSAMRGITPVTIELTRDETLIERYN